ncbi:MAG: TraR/DksA family transcriptional regulator [Halomonadaceae bacterium]|nr:MAG: TraR/DksA family transcriptional regulator [Halomonadaceae bacterium]
MKPADYEKFTAQLQALKAELLETSATRDETSATVALDQSSVGRLSRMDALQSQAIAVAGKARAQQQLRLIEAALRRLEAGEFGECQECGEAINPKRLAIDPTCLYCIECAS